MDVEHPAKLVISLTSITSVFWVFFITSIVGQSIKATGVSSSFAQQHTGLLVEGHQQELLASLLRTRRIIADDLKHVESQSDRNRR
mmetsp:Transcript_8588/g.15583  ORF Transcript_8588/g.15583 Transcript_8588/m.15583 type:complete len:86 (+) Transcript_8588:175-432(+)